MHSLHDLRPVDHPHPSSSDSAVLSSHAAQPNDGVVDVEINFARLSLNNEFRLLTWVCLQLGYYFPLSVQIQV